jgi:hypothetical protein
MKKIVILIILLSIFYYAGYIQGSEKSFWSKFTNLFKENNYKDRLINEIKEIPQKLPQNY